MIVLPVRGRFRANTAARESVVVLAVPVTGYVSQPLRKQWQTTELAKKSTTVITMPLGLFGNKFSPKKTPPRRAQSLSNLHLDATESKAEFGLDYGELKVSLGGNQVAFENGLWVNETGGGSSHKEVSRLRKQNQTLHEENNFLKLKIDILLDMLAEQSAVSHFHENEVRQLREAKLGTKKR